MFWDSSAIVPLLVHERSSQTMQDLFTNDDDVVIWWGTPVECASALEHKMRNGLPEDSYAASYLKLDEFVSLAQEVPPDHSVRVLAVQLMQRHRMLGVRAADALQLAAARALADRIASLRTHFVCLDNQLRQAAAREGMTIIPA